MPYFESVQQDVVGRIVTLQHLCNSASNSSEINVTRHSHRLCRQSGATTLISSVVCLTLIAAGLVSGSVGSAAENNNRAVVDRVGGDIQYLASEELEGRAPGTDGLQKAAEYMRDAFQEAGLTSGVEDGSYFQPFEISLATRLEKDDAVLVLHGPQGESIPLKLGADYQALAIGGSGKVNAEIVFAGYGISAPDLKYDDFDGLDVAGKVLLVIRREPQQGNPKSAFDGKKTTPHSYIRTKVKAAKGQQAAAVLFVNDPFTTKGKKDELVPATFFGAAGNGLPFAHLTQQLVNQLLEKSPVRAGDDKKLTSVAAIEAQIDEQYRPLSQALTGWTAEIDFTFAEVSAEVANVVGVLEGEGPLANETVVIGAHYDHLGFGPFGSRRPTPKALHPGADDNATGTAAVVELARRFAARGKRPARRMVFMGFTAEERGLFGSNHYVKEPLFPLADTVAMINFDMIGRLRDDKVIINGARSGKQFPALLDQANQDESLQLDKGGTLMGGDHFGFYQKRIPAVHFFTGLTEDYHTPDDTFEKINVAGVVKTIDFCERFLDAVVALPERAEYVKVARGRQRAAGGMAYLGITPDYSSSGDGLKVTEVSNGSPAQKGGLAAGDVIRRIGKIPVTDIQGLADGLRANKPGVTVEIEVLRGDEKKTLNVTLGRPTSGR